MYCSKSIGFPDFAWLLGILRGLMINVSYFCTPKVSSELYSIGILSLCAASMLCLFKKVVLLYLMLSDRRDRYEVSLAVE